MKSLLSIFTILFLVVTLQAEIVNVPADQPDIQAGIDAATNGDTVLVADGTYFENINYKGKLITVASHYIMDGDTNHINNTIIDGSQPSNPDSGSVVFFVSGEDTTAILSGFTITGGSGTSSPPPFPGWYGGVGGGGILILWSGAKIEKNKIINNHITAIMPSDSGANGSAILAFGGDGDHLVMRDNLISENTATSADWIAFGAVNWGMKERCVFERNEVSANVVNGAYAHGGGLIFFGDPGLQGAYIVRNNIIKNNTVNETLGGGFGGGIYIQNCSPEITNNIISGNSSKHGGGVSVRHLAQGGIPNPVFINNTITNNNATSHGGGFQVGGSSQAMATVMNTILWGNNATIFGSQIDIWGGASITMRYSDVQGGWSDVGNINADPQFVAGDPLFHLGGASPCINTGADSLQINGQWYFCPKNDYEGDVRPYQGHNTDIGADETQIVGIELLPFEGLPGTYALQQNYPNPFNPSTTIEFTVAKTGFVTLQIYNVAGANVATLVAESLNAGSYKYQWDARGLASGVYFYRLEAGNFTRTRKLLLLR